MDSYRVVFEGFESAGVLEEIRAKLSAKGLRAVIQSDSEAPEGFKLSPEVASIIVSGIGALPVVLSSLLWLNSNKGTKCDMASSPNPFCTLRFVSLD